MRKLLLALMTSLLVVSCSSPESDARKALKAEVEKVADDPKSFEINELVKVDTFNVTKSQLDLQKDLLSIEKEYLQTYEKEKGGEYWYIYKDSYSKIKSSVDKYSKIVDSLEKQIKDPVLLQRHFFSVRGKNKFGALVKSEVIVSKNIKTGKYSFSL